jgi:uncharacterized protein YecT (DUF1311 family)
MTCDRLQGQAHGVQRRGVYLVSAHRFATLPHSHPEDRSEREMPNRFATFAAVAAASAAVTLAASAPAGASASHATKLSPPVIHEPFTPMPCTGSPGNRTTLQQEGCAEQQILRSDKQINTLNQKIFTALHTTSARRDLLSGHRAWLAYRKSYCLSVSDVFQGGSLAGVVDADCTATVSGQHVSNLKTFLKDLTSHG